MGRRQLAFEELYRVDPVTGCWNWIGDANYGEFPRFRGRSAMRHAWEQAKGHATPPRSRVWRNCYNQRCVNPFHLRMIQDCRQA